jgi:hypothetical protein
MILRKRRVLIHLVDSRSSFEGILVGIDANHYRLANPRELVTADQTRDLTGDLWLPRQRVLYVQVLG